MSLNVYLGIDVGSVTTKLALVNEKGKYVDSYMLKTAGKPVDAVQNGMKQILSQALQEYSVQGVGTTGSGRNLAGALVGADVVKNETELPVLLQCGYGFVIIDVLSAWVLSAPTQPKIQIPHWRKNHEYEAVLSLVWRR